MSEQSESERDQVIAQAAIARERMKAALETLGRGETPQQAKRFMGPLPVRPKCRPRQYPYSPKDEQ